MIEFDAPDEDVTCAFSDLPGANVRTDVARRSAPEPEEVHELAASTVLKLSVSAAVSDAEPETTIAGAVSVSALATVKALRAIEVVSSNIEEAEFDAVKPATESVCVRNHPPVRVRAF